MKVLTGKNFKKENHIGDNCQKIIQNNFPQIINIYLFIKRTHSRK